MAFPELQFLGATAAYSDMSDSMKRWAAPYLNDPEKCRMFLDDVASCVRSTFTKTDTGTTALRAWMADALPPLAKTPPLTVVGGRAIED